MLNKSEIKEEAIIEFNKRFANGEQYIEFNACGEIVDNGKYYYWQEREVYNHIQPIVERYANSLTDESIYGRDGLVERLIPYQSLYNRMKNKEMEYINRITMGVLCVENGSVDTDDLEEEGLASGKTIVYRQGRIKPELMTGELKTQSYIDSANECLKQMLNLAREFVKTYKKKS